MNREERRQFVRDHRTAVFGYARKADGPAMSVVYYFVAPDDTILVSTTRDRGKARAVTRNSKVSLCVLDEQFPLGYLDVYCDAEVDDDPEAATDLMMQVAGIVSGQELDAGLRPIIAENARKEGRVVLRLRPYATFMTAPKRPGVPDDDGPAALDW